MSAVESAVTLPSTPERITIVLKAQDGSTLEQICQFISLGMPVAIGRGMAVIAGASDDDLQMVLGQERDERWMQAQLQEEAIGAPAHLAAHAQEIFDLLHRINVKVGGLNAVLGHGGEPSEQMWDEHNEAMDAIWDLLDKVQSSASVDKDRVNQIAQTSESVNQTTDIPAVADSMHIDDRVKMVGAEPAFMTVVFKLPTLNDAQALIDKLPYREKALGTEAEVFGYSAGNLMEDAPCEQ